MVAIMLMAATCLCFVAASDDAEAMNVDGAVTYIKTSESTSFTITDYETALYYTAELLNDDGVAMTSAISTSYQKGQLTLRDGIYQNSVSVTSPSEAGDYKFHVVFYSDSDRLVNCGEKYIPLKVVDPITLTVTLSNTGHPDMTFSAYFIINGERYDLDSDVTVIDGKTKDVTYEYVVKTPSQTTYSLNTDDATAASAISGLGQEKTFYTSQYDATMLTVVAVIIIVVLVILLIVILRKPVINKGKPKGRR